VAAHIPHPLKRWRIWLGGLLAAPVLVLALFLIAAWIGSSLPRNSEWSEPTDGITIMVETNGIHTGIVMPVTTRIKDGRETFPTAGLPREDGQFPTHIAIGWGEKEVFLNTPTWSDLSPSTALRIVFHGGSGLLRVAHYVRPAPSPNHRPLRLREEEYARLVARIEQALPPEPRGAVRTVYTSYEPNAVHYDATGRYTLGNTCNQWVGDTLAFAGITMGRWTPLAGGVMKWIPEPNPQD